MSDTMLASAMATLEQAVEDVAELGDSLTRTQVRVAALESVLGYAHHYARTPGFNFDEWSDACERLLGVARPSEFRLTQATHDKVVGDLERMRSLVDEATR